MAKVFWIPAIDGQYGDAKRLQDIPDDKMYARAHKAYPNSPEYVEAQLDGKGYIEIKAVNGKFRYEQDSL